MGYRDICSCGHPNDDDGSEGWNDVVCYRCGKEKEFSWGEALLEKKNELLELVSVLTDGENPTDEICELLFNAIDDSVCEIYDAFPDLAPDENLFSVK